MVTNEEIDVFMKELTIVNPSQRDFVVFTGREGMIDFDLAMMYPDCRVSLSIKNKVHTQYRFKRIRSIYYFSLFKKYGNWKVILDTSNKTIPFKLMNGTVEVSQFTSNESLNKAIEKL